MKIASACFALCFAATVALAADPVTPPSAAPASGKPELRGVMDLGSGQRFLLLLPGGSSSNWAKVGDTVGAWKVADYHENDRTLVLKQDDGTELDLSLAADPVKEGDVPATLADAKALMQKMNFGDMMTRILAQQRQAISAIMKQQMLRRGMSADDAAAAVAKQSQAMDAFWKAMDMNSLQDDIAGAYSQVFTKDELGGIADFYDTAAGQALLAKTPEIQQKTMQIMMPRMMQAMASAQAARAAAPAAPAAPAASAAP
jgi:hypothetical protein